MAEGSGLVKAAQESTQKSGGNYCGKCGNPSCVCGGYKPDAASVAIPGNQNTLDAAFGPSKDEHTSSMFTGLK